MIERPKSREETPKEGCDISNEKLSHCKNDIAPHNFQVWKNVKLSHCIQ